MQRISRLYWLALSAKSNAYSETFDKVSKKINVNKYGKKSDKIPYFLVVVKQIILYVNKKRIR